MADEAEYTLKHEIAEAAYSTSPCLLADKVDGPYRFCTDFKEVNAVTKPDYYPRPPMHLSGVKCSIDYHIQPLGR